MTYLSFDRSSFSSIDELFEMILGFVSFWILLFVFTSIIYLIPKYDRSISKSLDFNANTKSFCHSVINFSKIIHLSHSILRQSKRYSQHLDAFRAISVIPFASNDEALIDNAQLERLLKVLNEKTNSSKCVPTKQLRSLLFYLKTHKTGSSTLNGIIWRNLCFANQSFNCFLPFVTNPGKTFDHRHTEEILSSKGTANHTHGWFDVWNSHIRVAYFEYLHSHGDVKDPFSRKFFKEIVPNPRYFISILRRPSHRFESAFHWYELMDIYRLHLNSFPVKKEESSYVSFKTQLSSKTAVYPNKNKKRVKNRINTEKLTSNSSNSSSVLLIELIEDIAYDIIQSIQRKLHTRCNHPYLHCQRDLFNEISKEAIDDVLSSFEMIFHHRSGFQTLSKELLGINQFQSTNDDQKTFETSFSLLLQVLLSSSLSSSKMPPTSHCLSQMFLLNIEEMETSILLLQSILNTKSILPFLYLTQKQQSYQKLSHDSFKSFEIYYEFLDLLQYYDLLLYTIQTSLLSTLTKTYHINKQRIDEFREGLILLQETCSTTHSSMKVNVSDLEAITEKWNQWIDNDWTSIKSLMKSMNSYDLNVFCQLYRMDNYDYVQYFHYRNQRKTN